MKLKLPNVEEQSTEQTNIILEMNANIKEILNEIIKMQSEEITEANEKETKEILGKADLIITECHSTKRFHIQKNDRFNRLVYEYQRLNLKYESYQISKKIRKTIVSENQEELVEQEIDCDLNHVVAANGGEIPKPLKHAMKIIVEYFYNNRGSDDVAQIPEAFFHMCKLYRRYK